MLGSRQANTHHDTRLTQRHAVRSEEWWDFAPEQRVMTVDNVPGRVVAVHDGFVPGNEQYEVALDNDLGGGMYTAGQLSSLGPPKTADVHTAADDYPEMGTVLQDRPNIALPQEYR